MCTVQDVYNFINMIAPFETQEDFDNSGMIVGEKGRKVHGILVTLDVTENVVREAIEKGADLIISHHPLLFHARKNLMEEDPEGRILCELVRNRISVISAHTNLDRSSYSGSACIAGQLGLKSVRVSGYLFIGELPVPAKAHELSVQLEQVLGTNVRVYGDSNKIIRNLAIAGGSYDIGFTEAIAEGCDALVTGEVRHHNALTASMEHFVLFDGTHWATEAILVPSLVKALQNAPSIIKYNIPVYQTECSLFE